MDLVLLLLVQCTTDLSLWSLYDCIGKSCATQYIINILQPHFTAAFVLLGDLLLSFS